MSAQPGLFPESMQQVIDRLDGEILALLLGGAGGKFSLALSPAERKVLAAIRYHRGHNHAISLDDIQTRTSINGRTVKHVVRSLRMNFRLPIGSSKHSAKGGYFLMIDPEDIAIWRGDVLDQVRAELEVIRAAAGDQTVQELLGQLRVEVSA